MEECESVTCGLYDADMGMYLECPVCREMHQAQWQQLQQKSDRLRKALDKLIILQAHYAKLLNMHDGGDRHSFANAQEWLDRLDDMAAKKGGA